MELRSDLIYKKFSKQQVAAAKKPHGLKRALEIQEHAQDTIEAAVAKGQQDRSRWRDHYRVDGPIGEVGYAQVDVGYPGDKTKTEAHYVSARTEDGHEQLSVTHRDRGRLKRMGVAVNKAAYSLISDQGGIIGWASLQAAKVLGAIGNTVQSFSSFEVREKDIFASQGNRYEHVVETPEGEIYYGNNHSKFLLADHSK